MTLAEYMDPQMFPLSNAASPDWKGRIQRRGLCEQIYADAYRHDEFEANPPAAGTPAAALYAELKRKIAAWKDPTFDAEMKADARRRGVAVGWGVLAGMAAG